MPVVGQGDNDSIDITAGDYVAKIAISAASTIGTLAETFGICCLDEGFRPVTPLSVNIADSHYLGVGFFQEAFEYSCLISCLVGLN